MAAQKLAGVKGMNDLLPQTSARWQRFEEIVASWARSYGYSQIRTPIVEPTPLFARGLGTVTDIVEKEMYSFRDALNGEELTLRPEGTAGVVRAVIEHNLLYDGPRRLWYLGPMFRHERPQRGRYRQFHQVGVEALGYGGPEVDAEVIAMGQRLWDDLGIEGLQLQINSIGDAPERARHRQDLIDHFEKHAELLDEEAKRRLHANPLRILDSKNPAMQEIIEQAPRLIDYLEGPSREHFEQLRGYLARLGIEATLNPRLVRGMDYYNRTVFEWVTDRLGAQATVCGGGRYDALIEMLGGKPAPACGFAIGVERLLDLVEQAGGLGEGDAPDVYLISSG
ncbi:MAG: histidine--tRNA ligase, partial [Lautropia mirabilis]